jgi:prepilin-type N-terminal cleavage/methylation domain-containing protein/prepilin-type processing-associated H-X9-DG protein
MVYIPPGAGLVCTSKSDAAVMSVRWRSNLKQCGSRKGFTLIEALVVAGIIGLLASVILPALAGAKGRGYRIVCLNNERQLGVAWTLYADDREGYLAYNYGMGETYTTVASGQFLNWANNVMTWDLKQDNTNEVQLTRGGLGPYLLGVVSPFRCPSDRALSDEQRGAGWRERTRSYSMNAQVGYAGGYIKGTTNINNPKLKQFVRMGEIPNPSGIFVFIEEHPHSINDGYFLYRRDELPSLWYDLPASYHNRGANLIFADTHVEYRKWVSEGTVQPPVELAVNFLPMPVPLVDTRDFDWLMQRTSVPAY